MTKKVLCSMSGLLMLIVSAATADIAPPGFYDFLENNNPCLVETNDEDGVIWQICFIKANDGSVRSIEYTIKTNDDITRELALLIDVYRRHRLEISLAFQSTDGNPVHWLVRAPGCKRFSRSDYSGYDDQSHASKVADFTYDQIRLDWKLFFVNRLTGVQDPYALISLRYWPEASVPGFTSINYFSRVGVFDGLCHGYEWDGNCFGLVPAIAPDWTVTTRWPWPTLEVDRTITARRS